MPEPDIAHMIDFIPRDGYEGLWDELGWHNVVIYRIAGDASFRRYFRISHGDENAILMDAPPEHEDVRPFVQIAKHLQALGFSAPEILGENPVEGFLLLEDFGDNTFTALLKGGVKAGELYELATDTLMALHQMTGEKTAPNWLAPYDDEKLLAETALFPDWFMPAVGLDGLSGQARAAHDKAWLDAFAVVHKGPRTLVLRDYHVDNLLRLDGRDGVKACGLLDFQDAVAGHPAYDLMSLLEDARLDVAPELQQAMTTRYHDAMQTKNRETFDAAYAILGASRHAKVIGIFTRLYVRDAKEGYLDHISRVWRLLEASLQHPALAQVKTWFDKHVPQDKRMRPEGGA